MISLFFCKKKYKFIMLVLGGDDMYYANIIKNDTNNGDGFRVSLFVSGCTRRCSHCWNKELWSPCYGKEFTDDVKEKMFKELSKSYYDGLSILGRRSTYGVQCG